MREAGTLLREAAGTEDRADARQHRAPSRRPAAAAPSHRIRGKAKDKTLDQYEQRFRNSVDMYRKWLAGERDWAPSRSRAGAAKSRPSAGTDASTGSEVQTRAANPSSEVWADGSPHVGMVTYPLPIRPSLKATLILPEDLSAAEARRIAAFVSAVAFDHVPGCTVDTDSAVRDDAPAMS